MIKRSPPCILPLILSILACTSTEIQPSPTSPPVVAPELEASLTATLVLATQVPTPTPDSAAFELNLRSALKSKDFAQLEKQMGNAFLIQFVDGASGMITITDAVTILRESLLAGAASVVIDETLDARSVTNADLTSMSFNVEQALFSRGWGENAGDHALILIARDVNSEPYFAGLIYARGGFAGIAAATSPATATDEAFSPTPVAAAPAPRGASVYVSDFRQGWWEHEENNVKSIHTAGGYAITVGNGPNAGWSFTTRTQRSEFYAEITTEVRECPSLESAYGLLFHYTDDSHFRFFMIWCDGKYSLMERTATSTAAVLIEGVLPNAIDAASGQNRIGILAQDGTIALYVNDIRTGAIAVPTMPIGDIGPYVQTLEHETISVLFTQLTIYETR
jgi:hypothetical protein